MPSPSPQPANVIDRRALLIHARTKRDGRKKAKVIREGSVAVRVFDVRGTGRKLRFEVRYRFAGRLNRKTFTARITAEEFAREQATKIASGKTASLDLTPERQALLEYCEANGVTAKTISVALHLHRRGMLMEERLGQRLNPIAWIDRKCDEEEALHFAQIGRTVPAVVTEFLSDVKSRALGQKSSLHHWRALSVRLGKFAAVFTGPIGSLMHAPIVRWLNSLKLAPKTWNHYRGAVVQLVRFAKDRKYITREVLDDLAAFKPYKIRSGRPNPYTPAELRAILDHTRENAPEFLGFIVLVGLCGFRVEEVVSREKPCADWRDVKLDNDGIKIWAAQSKVAVERFSALPVNAKAWLRIASKTSGQICPWVKPDQKLRKICAKLGIPVKENGLRHAFISHRVALTNDIAEVADRAGTSVSKIRKHYLKLVTKKEAVAYFTIEPADLAQLTLC